MFLVPSRDLGRETDSKATPRTTVIICEMGPKMRLIELSRISETCASFASAKLFLTTPQTSAKIDILPTCIMRSLTNSKTVACLSHLDLYLHLYLFIAILRTSLHPPPVPADHFRLQEVRNRPTYQLFHPRIGQLNIPQSDIRYPRL